jgi:hypothetical protein
MMQSKEIDILSVLTFVFMCNSKYIMIFMNVTKMETFHNQKWETYIPEESYTVWSFQL